MSNQYIESLNLKSIRDFILDNNLKDVAIGLNQFDMDELAEEYRETCGKALKEPFYILDTLIEEDNSVSKGSISIREIEYIPPRNDLSDFPSIDYSNEIVHRCGWCGSVVDYDGKELEPLVREFKIELLEKHIRDISVKYVVGECCYNKRHLI